MSPNSWSNVAVAVSVSTRVPATNPTPRTTATPVSSSRSFRASRLLIVARHTGSALQRLHAVEDLLGRRVPHLVHDASVGQEDDPVRVRGGRRVVGDHDDGL